jgi:hypothetical protein
LEAADLVRLFLPDKKIMPPRQDSLSFFESPFPLAPQCHVFLGYFSYLTILRLYICKYAMIDALFTRRRSETPPLIFYTCKGQKNRLQQ